MAAYPDWSRWLTPLLWTLASVAALGLVALRLLRLRGAIVFAALGVVALLLAPAAWSLTPVLYAGDSGLPYAGPDLAARPRGDRNPDSSALVAASSLAFSDTFPAGMTVAAEGWSSTRYSYSTPTKARFHRPHS